ncbi:MAG: hypothetical protein FJX74_22330 [Armatimonadetes bacterium]|nr:hypothetical protein [Armatimonadota bacterium]
MQLQPQDGSLGEPVEGESAPGDHRSGLDADDLLRARARALRPWAWATLLACVLAIVFVGNTFLLGAVADALRVLEAPGTSGFWSVVAIVALWGLWIVAGIAALTAFRRWLRGAFGPVWRRALRRIPKTLAAVMAVAVALMTLLMGGAWKADVVLLGFVSLTWAVIVAVSARPPRL